MIFTTVVWIVVGVVVLAFLFIILGMRLATGKWFWDVLFHLKDYETQGGAGERILYRVLKQLGVKDEQVFRNLYVPLLGGQTAEIDAVVVSKKAVFVFEVKNYAGMVYGSPKYPKWYYFPHRRSKKVWFESPLLQNRGHVKALESFLKDYQGLRFVSVVVVTDRAEWKINDLDRIGPYEVFIANGQFLEEFSALYASLEPMRLKEGTYTKVYAALKSIAHVSEEVKQLHNLSVRRGD
jgi:hypothetical protein